MAHDPQRPVHYSCPYCEQRALETVATATYVRGMFIAHQIGHDTFIGCVPCVRSRLMTQAGLSMFVGWFSLMSIMLNPILILLNLLRAPLIRVDYAAVREKLKELGIPENEADVDITALCYSLAASMITVDGDIDEREIRIATTIGKRLLADFDESAFYAQFDNPGTLPAPVPIATLLSEILNDEAKHIVLNYLTAIAQADEKIEATEEQLLRDITRALAF